MEEDRQSERLQEIIGYYFDNPELLHTALRHSSYLNEHGMDYPACNERLEYLGDAVLELAASRTLFHSYPEKHEGELTRMRAALVCESSLAAVAAEIQLGRYLQMGKGEEKTGGRKKGSLLSDAVEALIGAIYLDAGFEAANDFIKRYIFREHPGYTELTDHKSRLQEYLQRGGPADIQYHTLEETVSNEAGFSAEVLCGGKVLGRGTGHSKKEAEQNAAGAALRNLH